MEIDVLYFDGCPNHEALLPHLRDLLTRAGVDGVDVDPAAGDRTDFGLKRRLYATSGGLQGMPPDEWVLRALARRSTEADHRTERTASR